jgi:hypothetical protein
MDIVSYFHPNRIRNEVTITTPILVTNESVLTPKRGEPIS